MALLDYTFKYDQFEASAIFRVDTEKFTEEHALATLNFFSWDWNKEGDILNEAMKKYAMTVIRIATFNGYNERGVIREMKTQEGYCRVDGSVGLTLLSVEAYEFDEDYLTFQIKPL
ncbi:MAG: hypothetical protein CMM93_08605 [Rickettsiales bacterium]|nr:hypothetical protein [Rickettsiales bacterium]